MENALKLLYYDFEKVGKTAEYQKAYAKLTENSTVNECNEISNVLVDAVNAEAE